MEEHIQAKPVRRRRISLLHLFLLIAIVAIGVAIWDTRRQTQTLEAQLPGLRSVARELTIADPHRYAAVHRHPKWWNELVWEVYLPAGNSYRAAIAEGIVSEEGLIDPAETFSLEPGRHVLKAIIDRSDDQRVFTLFIDDQERWSSQTDLEPTKPSETSYSTGGTAMSESISQSIDEPLVLFRERYFRRQRGQSWPSDEPGPGYLLWIFRS